MLSNKEIILVSVIVPIYNAEKYLEKCIDSIINQTYKNLEIILINDGSKDSSLSIIQKYESLDCRISIIDKENEGLVCARKDGVNVAKGKYIVWVDADDWIESNMIEEMVTMSDDADMVISGTIRDYGDHTVVDNEKFEKGTYTGDRLKKDIVERLVTIKESVKLNISAYIWNKMTKLELLRVYENRVPNEVVVGEDLACTYPCILNSSKIVITGNSYYHYCVRPNSMVSTGKQNEYYPQLFESLKAVYTSLYNNDDVMLQQFYALRYYYYLLKNHENIIGQQGDELVPFGRIVPSSKVLLYGAGKFGKLVYEYLEKKKICEIVGWVDKSFDNMNLLKSEKYDLLLVSAVRQEVIDDIVEQLYVQGIAKDKILTLNCQKYFERWR